MPTQPSKRLETFDNPHPERDYTIQIRIPEFTCLCPKTGQPDFATLYLDYIPDRQCVELKALKLYVWAYRNEGAFHEAVTNTILSDLVAATAPRYMRLRAEFYVRGGIYTTVTVEHRKPGWVPPPPPPPFLPLDGEETDAPPLSLETIPDNASATQKQTSAASGSRFRMLARARRPAEEADTPNTTHTPPAPQAKTPQSPAPIQKQAENGVYLGIDLGTGGCRVAAVNQHGEVLAQAAAPIPMPLKNDNQITQDPGLWWKALSACLQNLFKEIDPSRVRSLAVDGTSGTLLLCDKKGVPVIPALMYNDFRASAQAEKIAAIAGKHSGAHGATSSLAKLLWLQDKGMHKKAAHALHQADWITGKLTGLWGHSDYNNCLKLGYDVEAMQWPNPLGKLGVEKSLLPEIHRPGEVLGPISAETAKTFGLSPEVLVVTGTTDGVASFLASGADTLGTGVTALGTSLVLKLLSDKPIFSAEHGVYSHRLGDRWLAGGASNSGGGVLLQYFKIEQMREMTPLLDPESSTGLDYYPLPDVGERFPINDPNMLAKLEPLPGNSVTFFQGMLEGIGRIEVMGYQLLHKLGAPALREIRTTGGGSRNPAWQRIRERTLGVPFKKPYSESAAVGTALLAAGALASQT